MKLLKVFTFLFLALLFLNGYSQNQDDALRYSQSGFGGTARYMGLSGAFGALGADFSTLSTNPAGIGLYKKSEITFTPSFYSGRTSSSYMNSTNDDYKYNFNISNIGVIYTFYEKKNFTDEKPDWCNVQFGFGLNRVLNFNNRQLTEGYNPSSSLLNQYLSDAQGRRIVDLNYFDTRLAFDTYLLDTLGGATHYVSAVPNGDVLQRKSVTSSGSLNEMVVSLGGNYADRLYLGVTVGLPYLNYKETSTYKEIDEKNKISNFNEFTLNKELITTGAGVNAKFGMIFRAADWIRIGAALHTPTFYYTMHDEWKNTLSSDLGAHGTYSAESPSGRYDYKLTTPMKAMGSLALISKKLGLISVDYEYIDYSEARLRADDYDFFDENTNIRSFYHAVSNLRFGAEYRFAPFAIRGGYALYGNPYKSTINDAQHQSFSFGFGMRQELFFIDLAYVYSLAKEDYYLYDRSLVGPASNEISSNNILVTLGLRY